jgi:hypothetical protein
VRFPKRLFVSLAVLSFTPVLIAQIGTGPGATVRFSDGGVAGRMESIFVPPKPRAPFSLTLSTEWTKPVSEGGSFTLVNERRIMRDGEGRIYQERWYLVPKGGKMKPRMNAIQITDPHQHIRYNCETQTKVCDVSVYLLSATESYAPSPPPSGPLPQGRGFVESDDLGTGTTAGIETHGYRQVTTFNPGAMGNEQEMKATREFWYSPQLGVNLLSIVDQPSSGKQVFRVTEMSTSEPDPAYFEVPEGYSVVDRRGDADPTRVKP